MLTFTHGLTEENLVKLDQKFEIHLPLAEAGIDYKSKVCHEINNVLLNFKYVFEFKALQGHLI